MIITPYQALREDLGKPEDWTPHWAKRLEVRRHGEHTVYHAHPEQVDAAALTELASLKDTGWTVTIDAQRLSRLRINIWQ